MELYSGYWGQMTNDVGCALFLENLNLSSLARAREQGKSAIECFATGWWVFVKMSRLIINIYDKILPGLCQNSTSSICIERYVHVRQ